MNGSRRRCSRRASRWPAAPSRRARVDVGDLETELGRPNDAGVVIGGVVGPVRRGAALRVGDAPGAAPAHGRRRPTRPSRRPCSGSTPSCPQAAASAATARMRRRVGASVGDPRPGGSVEASSRPPGGSAPRSGWLAGPAARRRPERAPGFLPQAGSAGHYTRTVRLPFEPPLEPMLAKAGRRPARRRRLAVRAEVGRLPGARLPRRRRGLHPEPRPQAARPLLPGARRAAPRRSCRSAACSTARSSSPRDGGARLRGAAAAHPPGRVAGARCWPRETPASFVAWDLLALGDEDLRAVPAGRAPGAARGGARRRPRRRST